MVLVKNPHASAGDISDMGLIPGLGSFPEGGIFLENPMDRGTLWATVHRVAKIVT